MGHTAPVSKVVQSCPQVQNHLSSLRGDQPQSVQQISFVPLRVSQTSPLQSLLFLPVAASLSAMRPTVLALYEEKPHRKPLAGSEAGLPPEEEDRKRKLEPSPVCSTYRTSGNRTTKVASQLAALRRPDNHSSGPSTRSGFCTLDTCGRYPIPPVEHAHLVYRT